MVFKLLKNILCLIGIALSCDYAYHWYCTKYTTQKPKPTALEHVIDTAKTSSKKVIDTAKTSSNTVITTVGNGLIGLGNITKKVQFIVEKPVAKKVAPKPQQQVMQQEAVTQPLQKETIKREPAIIKEVAVEKVPEKNFEFQDSRTKHELIAQLKESAQSAHNHLQKEDTLGLHEKNLLLARLKEVITQADHLKELLQKEPSTELSETIHNQTIERKMLALTHKLEITLTDLLNEITGRIIEHRTSKTVFEGIDHSLQLLLYLEN